jgi:predicted metal-dependent hydrolase
MQRNSLRHGVALFNRAHFFDAHEVLEDVWRSVPRDCGSRRHLRLHLQGMVQLAVAFHHQSTGNHVGARSVLERAMRNLNGADSSFPDLDLDRLRAELEIWRQHLDNSEGAVERKRAVEKQLDTRNVRRLDVLNSSNCSAPALPKIMRRR